MSKKRDGAKNVCHFGSVVKVKNPPKGDSEVKSLDIQRGLTACICTIRYYLRPGKIAYIE